MFFVCQQIAAIAVKADLSPASHGVWGGIIVSLLFFCAYICVSNTFQA